MSNLLLILIVLFVALILFANLAERFASPMPADKLAKVSRWILPLVMLLVVIQLVRYWL